MSFRKLSLLTFVFVLGCGKGPQSPNASSQIILKVGSTECLDGMGSKFQNFFNGTGSQADIHSVWTCLSQVVQNFELLTVGANPNQYSAAELQGFLQKYFFPNGLSDAAVSSTMQIKTVLVGGTNTAITRDEINAILVGLNNLDAVTTTLSPYMPTLFASNNNTVTDAQWSQAYQVLISVAPQLAQILGQGGVPCNLSDVQALITAWAAQLSLPSTNLFVELNTLVPSIGTVKGLLIGGSTTAFQPAEWQPLLTSTGNAYSYYRMGMRLLNTPNDVSLALQSPNLEWMIGGFVNTLTQAVQAQPNSQIPIATISTLMTNLNALGYFPTSVTPTEIANAIQVLMTKVFSQPQASATGIDQYHMAAMQSFMARWQQVELAVEQNNFTNLSELDASLHPGWAMPLDSIGRLIIPPPGSSPTYFREYSALYTVAEWLGNQYGTWPLTAADFQNMVTDGLNLFQSFGFLSGVTNSVAQSILTEANLFMPSSNGDMQLDLPEAFQYVLYVLSSYRGSNAFEQIVGTQCASTDYTCYQNILTQNRAALTSNFPQLDPWMTSHSSEWAPYLADIATAGGQGEWLKQFQVMHYIETFLQRWDTNRDQMIEMNEALNAYTVVGPVLGSMLGSLGVASSDDEPMYTYMVANGGTPTGMGAEVKYLFWKWHPDTWAAAPAADRKMLADILAALSQL